MELDDTRSWPYQYKPTAGTPSEHPGFWIPGALLHFFDIGAAVQNLVDALEKVFEAAVGDDSDLLAELRSTYLLVGLFTHVSVEVTKPRM